MNPSVIPAPTPPKKSRVLSARRVVLLATTIASLGAAALVVAPGLNLSGGYPAALAQNLTEQAHKLQAPVGFADIVEKVKPAVISVRVKVDGGAQTNGLANNDVPPGLREFFRRFGMPDMPNRTARTACRKATAVTLSPARAPASLFPATALR